MLLRPTTDRWRSDRLDPRPALRRERRQACSSPPTRVSQQAGRATSSGLRAAGRRPLGQVSRAAPSVPAGSVAQLTTVSDPGRRRRRRRGSINGRNTRQDVDEAFRSRRNQSLVSQQAQVTPFRARRLRLSVVDHPPGCLPYLASSRTQTHRQGGEQPDSDGMTSSFACHRRFVLGLSWPFSEPWANSEKSSQEAFVSLGDRIERSWEGSEHGTRRAC